MNISKLKWFRVNFDKTSYEQLMELDRMHKQALRIWLFACIELAYNGGTMLVKKIVSSLANKRMSRAEVHAILCLSGDFIITEDTITFTEDAKVKLWGTRIKEKEIIEDTPDQFANKTDTKTSQVNDVCVGKTSQANDACVGKISQANDACVGKISQANDACLGKNSQAKGVSSMSDNNVRTDIENIENRELENKESFSNSVSMLLAQTENANEIKFYQYLLKNYPNVCKMKIGITWEQYAKLRKKGYSEDTIFSILAEMENRSDLTKKYRSAYLTLSCWLRIDKQRRERRTGQSSG